MEFLKGFFLPSHLAVELFALALLACVLGRTRRYALALLIASGAVLALFSSGWVAAALMGPLEYEHPALGDLSSYRDVRRIVVLTGYGNEDPAMPLSSQPNSASLYRVVEAVSLTRRCPECEVLISGNPAPVRVMHKLMLELGVPQEQIALDAEAYNTAASAANLNAVARGEPFFLVTSAGHMPRSLAVFESLGMKPIPAPTDFQLPNDVRRASVMPSPLHLYASDLAVHEYVGLLWYRLRGKIK